MAWCAWLAWRSPAKGLRSAALQRLLRCRRRLPRSVLTRRSGLPRSWWRALADCLFQLIDYDRRSGHIDTLAGACTRDPSSSAFVEQRGVPPHRMVCKGGRRRH